MRSHSDKCSSWEEGNAEYKSAPLCKRATRSHSVACDDETFMFPKESRRALHAVTEEIV